MGVQRGRLTSPRGRRFPFDFDRRFRPVLAVLGVRPGNASVLVTRREVTVGFGLWRMRIPRSNVAGVQVSGPFRWWKVLGPHLSLADRGVTFGTSTRRGVCIRLREPQPGLVPGRLLRHPGVTVTVADPQSLAKKLR